MSTEDDFPRILDGGEGQHPEVLEQFGVPFKARKTTLTEFVELKEPVRIHTREGVIAGMPGDYLARGIKGELYPVGRSIFDNSYEVVGE